MSNNQVKVDQIVAYLRTQTALTTLVPGGIYFGKTVYENTGANLDQSVPRYVRIDIVSDTSPDDVINQARLQFTVVGQDNDDPTALMGVINVLNDILCQPKFPKVSTLGTFNIIQCKSGMILGPGYDLHDRLVLKKDYIFYYATYTT